MENYIVSARKYRPATFESVVGQRALTTTLKNAIATGKLAHVSARTYGTATDTFIIINTTLYIPFKS